MDAFSTLPVESWTREQVSDWLRSNNFEKYVGLFLKHQIDGEVLLTVNEADLHSPPLGMSVFGHVRKLALAIEKLKKSHQPKNDETTKIPRWDQQEVTSHPTAVEAEAETQNFEENSAEELPFTNEFSQSLQGISESSAVDTSQAGKKSNFTEKAADLLNFYPEYCWVYDEDQEKLLRTFLDGQSVLNRGFSAEVSFLVSPVEFYLQPMFLVDEAALLIEKMTEFYENTDLDDVPFHDFIFERMPCAVKYNEDGKWYRAVVTHWGAEDCKVGFVDWGNGQFVNFSMMKPLLAEFGRLPPLTLRCRVDGVKERTLLQKVVDQFKDQVENVMDKRVYCVIKGRMSSVFYVDLLNADTRQDVGSKFWPTEPIIPGFKLTHPQRSAGDLLAHTVAVGHSNGPAVSQSTLPSSIGQRTSRPSSDDVEEIEASSSSSTYSWHAAELDDKTMKALELHNDANGRLEGAAAVALSDESYSQPTVSNDDASATLTSDTSATSCENFIEPPSLCAFDQILLEELNRGRFDGESGTVDTPREDIVAYPTALPADSDYPTTSVSHAYAFNGINSNFVRDSNAAGTVAMNSSKISHDAALISQGISTPQATEESGDSANSTPFHSYFSDANSCQRINKELLEKEKKFKNGEYANPLEAFLDGAPIFHVDDLASSQDDDSSSDEEKRRRLFRKKQKNLKQLARQLEQKTKRQMQKL